MDQECSWKIPCVAMFGEQYNNIVSLSRYHGQVCVVYERWEKLIDMVHMYIQTQNLKYIHLTY